ncbi:hypothetical protein EV13_1936 [Prochlorococcus sp. MIT 0702]|nr:hypothetical protein EV13_1936 [Prochlorococcus sp. MIT 0702]KGG32825.1 hypothetical protein EV14_1967 [Prochlorococcus sp. MIT 0703]
MGCIVALEASKGIADGLISKCLLAFALFFQQAGLSEASVPYSSLIIKSDLFPD